MSDFESHRRLPLLRAFDFLELGRPRSLEAFLKIRMN
jgi:hypothetical protein